MQNIMNQSKEDLQYQNAIRKPLDDLTNLYYSNDFYKNDKR